MGGAPAVSSRGRGDEGKLTSIWEYRWQKEAGWRTGHAGQHGGVALTPGGAR